MIYQATFFDGRWLGLADFLVRVERPSRLGAWSYEVVDTKLARHVRASALLQICSYVEQLTAIQGLAPERMYVALGGSARTVESHRVADYMAYYRMVKAAFEERVEAGWRVRRRRVPAERAHTRSRSSTARSAAGARSAPAGGGPTTTSRSWPGHRPACAGR